MFTQNFKKVLQFPHFLSGENSLECVQIRFVEKCMTSCSESRRRLPKDVRMNCEVCSGWSFWHISEKRCASLRRTRQDLIALLMNARACFTRRCLRHCWTCRSKAIRTNGTNASLFEITHVNNVDKNKCILPVSIIGPMESVVAGWILRRWGIGF